MAQPGFKLSLKGRALRLLSQREHSRAELVRKLSPHEEVPGELVQVLDDLHAKGFIDETRVLESVVNHRASKLGNGRVKVGLRLRVNAAFLFSHYWLSSTHSSSMTALVCLYDWPLIRRT